MDEATDARYWCHACSQDVNPPIMEVEIICPLSYSGFVEQMNSVSRDNQGSGSHFWSDRLSLWLPIIMALLRSSGSRSQSGTRIEFASEEDSNNDDGEPRSEADAEFDREINAILSRRRSSGRSNNAAAFFQLLQNIRTGVTYHFEYRNRDEVGDGEDGDGDGDGDRERNRDTVILINPFNRTIIIEGPSYDPSQNQSTFGTLGDYFIGPGFDILLQHLAESDPNMYGTPPAQKEAIDAMPTVTIEENLQCSVCLDDFEIGTEAREMPCKHMFHNGCILPWLELHSSCPVCRLEIPSDESKPESNASGSGVNSGERRDTDSGEEGDEDGDGDGRSGIERRFSVHGLFSSGSQAAADGNPSSSSSSLSNSDVHEAIRSPEGEEGET